MTDVVVVGAGIVGASVASHLTCRGASVTLIDQASMPAADVTGGSFAWIGDTGGDWPGGAEDLRPSVRADHRRLTADVPAWRCAGRGRCSGRPPSGTRHSDSSGR